MKKSVLFVLLIIFIPTLLLCQTTINSWSDLNNVRNSLNGDYILGTDLDSGDAGYDTYASSSANSGKGWNPIGNDATNERFLGTFDGNGHTISDLYINRPDEGEVGLFGCLGYDAGGVTITDVHLIDVDVTGGRGTGSLVGRVRGNNDTRIELCFARTGTVVGDGATGGLVGANNSYKETATGAEGYKPVISKCYAHIDVSWSKKLGSGADKFGGLVGCNQKGITQFSYALGSVTVDNDPQVGSIVPERIGGLAGCTYLKGLIEDSYSASVVTTYGTVDRVGGLVGYMAEGGGGSDDGTVTDSYWDTVVSTQSSSAGGTGKTTDQMKNGDGNNSISDWSWSTDIWERVGYNYPQLKDNPDPTLPVELSIFTAQYINNIPTLYWVTQSETDNLGWNVYRNSQNDFTTSTRINNEFIPGHGTTTQVQNYFFEDTEGNFQPGDDYWYWLESIDYSGTVNYYNRVALIHIPEHQDPEPHVEVPLRYGLQSCNPNPFATNLSFKYMLPQTDLVRIEIYNVMGQLVAQSNEGVRTADNVYTFEWNAKDISGNALSSGVLLIKLITSDKTYTQKAILLD